jgi:xylulokinase
MALYLAVDMGTSSVKAGLFESGGELRGLGSSEYSLTLPAPEQVECEATVYWQAVLLAVRAAWARAEDLGHDRREVAALCMSCQGETMLCLDANGLPLGPAIVWLDNRADREARELAEIFGGDEIYHRTGQVECVATWPACKIMWIRRHDRERFARTSRFVLLADWMLQQLCGELVGDLSLYSSTLLMDIQQLSWWEPMLDELGLSADVLPPLVSPGTTVGRLSATAAHQLALPAGLPIVAGGLDQVLAAAGAGNLRPGLLTEMTGSIVAMATCLAEFPDRSHGLPLYTHVVDGQYCALPYAQTGGLALRWLRDSILGASSAQASVPFDAFAAEAATVSPGSDGLLFLPHLAGAFFPEFDLAARGALVGLTLSHTRAHIIRAALESVAYVIRAAIDAVRMTGMAVDHIVSLGGGSESALWRQIKASASGVPVRRISCPEASLLGAAMLAAVASGEFANLAQAAGAMCHPFDEILPDPGAAAAYEAAYARYRYLYTQLRPFFAAAGRREQAPRGSQ